MCVSIKTSQILDEVLKFHLSFELDVGAVHVSVEEDDGESQDEDGVRVSELTDHIRVTDAVALAEQRHTTDHNHVKTFQYETMKMIFLELVLLVYLLPCIFVFSKF